MKRNLLTKAGTTSASILKELPQTQSEVKPGRGHETAVGTHGKYFEELVQEGRGQLAERSFGDQ